MLEHKRIQNSIRAYETVLTYAIDSTKPQAGSPLLDSLELSPSTFFERLYVHRKRLEEEIGNYIQQDIHALFIVGPAGCGKTSLASKVIRDFEKQGTLVLHIDFKSLLSKADSSLERADEASDWIRNLIVNRLNQQLLNNSLARYELAVPFMTPDGLSHILNAAANHHRMDLHDKYIEYRDDKDEEELPIDEWFDRCLREDRDEGVIKLAQDLARSLRPEEMLFSLTRCLATNVSPPCILFLDNTDSIPSLTIRDNVHQYIRTMQPALSDCARIVISTRPGNLTRGLPDDHGAYFVQSVKVDWEGLEKADEDAEDLAKFSFVSPRHRLDSEIVAKRTEFLYTKSKEVSELSRSTLDRLEKWSAAMQANSHIVECSSSISNYDRRKMIITRNNFTLYMDQHHPDFDPDSDQGSFNLESHYYLWLISDPNTGVIADVYNPLKGLEEWESDPVDCLGCLQPHLILAVIFNAAGSVARGYPGTKRVSVSQIVNICKGVGMSDDVVRDELFKLFGGKDGYRGIIEISRHNQISMPSEIRNEDQVMLTPRACYLVQYLAYKLSYVIALLKHSKMSRGRALALKPDVDNVSEATLKAVLKTLSRLAGMYLCGLDSIRIQMNSSPGWLVEYRKAFCLRLPAGSQYSDKHGNLAFENLMGSIDKFLVRTSARKAIRDQYTALRYKFQSEVEALSKTVSKTTHWRKGSLKPMDASLDYTVFA